MIFNAHLLAILTATLADRAIIQSVEEGSSPSVFNQYLALAKSFLEAVEAQVPEVPLNLDDLGDVIITAPAANEVLTYNGSNWVNQTGGAGSTTTTYRETFTATGSRVITHNLDEQYVAVQLYDSTGVLIQPSVTLTDADNLTLSFIGTLTNARVVVINRAPQAYRETFTASSSKVITHNFGQQHVLVQLYDSANTEIVPSITLNDANSLTLSFIGTLTSARVVVLG